MRESRSGYETASRGTNLLMAIALVAVAGVAVSSVSLYEHFATSTTSFCNFSDAFNCDLVNRSAYSTVLGVPVALVGIVGYVLVAALATVYRNQAQTPVLLLVASSSDWDLLSISLTSRSFCWECGAFFVLLR